MDNQGFTHAGLRVDVREHGVTIEADSAALYAWSRRPGYSWPCSELAHIDSLRAHFDAHGLVDTDASEDIPGDEFTAFTSDALRAVLPTDHPAYFVNVGQFD